MNRSSTSLALLATVAALAIPTIAHAQAPAAQLPPPQSFNDPTPVPASPTGATVGVTEQAGVGGTQAYGRAGVLELGGQLGFTSASNFTQVTVAPSLGWFFVDNLQLSAIVLVAHSSIAGVSNTAMNILAEPSYHLPLTDKLFLFGGVGAGLGYNSGPAGAGFALAPRVGLNIMIGRSGILTPSFNVVYNTNNAVSTPSGTVIAVSTTFGAGAGYTVMW